MERPRSARPGGGALRPLPRDGASLGGMTVCPRPGCTHARRISGFFGQATRAGERFHCGYCHIHPEDKLRAPGRRAGARRWPSSNTPPSRIATGAPPPSISTGPVRSIASAPKPWSAVPMAGRWRSRSLSGRTAPHDDPSPAPQPLSRPRPLGHLPRVRRRDRAALSRLRPLPAARRRQPPVEREASRSQFPGLDGDEVAMWRRHSSAAE
jgi:hypothetical protein